MARSAISARLRHVCFCRRSRSGLRHRPGGVRKCVTRVRNRARGVLRAQRGRGGQHVRRVLRGGRRRAGYVQGWRLAIHRRRPDDRIILWRQLYASRYHAMSRRSCRCASEISTACSAAARSAAVYLPRFSDPGRLLRGHTDVGPCFDRGRVTCRRRRRRRACMYGAARGGARLGRALVQLHAAHGAPSFHLRARRVTFGNRTACSRTRRRWAGRDR